MELYRLTIGRLHSMLKKGEVSSRELTESVLARAKEVEPKVNSLHN